VSIRGLSRPDANNGTPLKHSGTIRREQQVTSSSLVASAQSGVLLRLMVDIEVPVDAFTRFRLMVDTGAG
jgi:hypothetical protein